MGQKLAVLGIAVLAAGCNATNVPAVGTGRAFVVMNGVLEAGFFTAVNADCSLTGETNITILQAPKHGKLDIAHTTGNTNFTASNERNRCNVRKVAGVRVRYIPDRNFRGEDALAFQVIYPDGRSTGRRGTIVVQ